MNFLVKNFLRGLAIVIPFAVTIYILYRLVLAIDYLDRLMPVPIRGLGFAITVVAVVLIGALATNIVGRKLLEWTEQLFVKAPLVKIVYTSIKDLIDAFVGDKKRFNRPVVVALDETSSLRAFGFITREDLPFAGLEGSVTVYLPQSYNFAGNLVLVPRERVQPLPVDSSRMMAFIVSGGVSSLE